MNSQYTKCGSMVKIYRLFYNSTPSEQLIWNHCLFLKEPWPYFTTRFRLKKKTLNVYLRNSNYVKMNSQCTKCGSMVKICRLFYNSATSGQFETFFTLLKEPWPYFKTGFRPKKKTLNVYLCKFNTTSTYITSQ